MENKSLNEILAESRSKQDAKNFEELTRAMQNLKDGKNCGEMTEEEKNATMNNIIKQMMNTEKMKNMVEEEIGKKTAARWQDTHCTALATEVRRAYEE